MSDGSVDDLLKRLQKAVRETKSGWKTTEFWLTVVAVVVSIAMHFVDPTSSVGKIVAAGGSILAALGYGHHRTALKKTPGEKSDGEKTS